MCIIFIAVAAYLIYRNCCNGKLNNSKLNGGKEGDQNIKNEGAVTVMNTEENFNGEVVLIFKAGLVSRKSMKDLKKERESSLEQQLNDGENPEIHTKKSLISVCDNYGDRGKNILKNFNRNFNSVILYEIPITTVNPKTRKEEIITHKRPYLGYIERLLNMTVREILKRSFKSPIYNISDKNFKNFIECKLNNRSYDMSKLTVINSGSAYWINSDPEMYIIPDPCQDDIQTFHKFSTLRADLLLTLCDASKTMFTNPRDPNNWITLNEKQSIAKQIIIDSNLKKMKKYVNDLTTRLINTYINTTNTCIPTIGRVGEIDPNVQLVKNGKIVPIPQGKRIITNLPKHLPQHLPLSETGNQSGLLDIVDNYGIFQ